MHRDIMKTFPDSLKAPTPAEGHALARRVAQFALAEGSNPRVEMAAHLSNTPAPSLEILTAVYFQTVAAANGAWQR